MSIIERGARALAKAQSGEDCYDVMDEAFQENLRDHVRAVLEAIREPSAAMVEAAEDRDDPGSDIFGDPFTPVEHGRAWTIMIDAALQDD